MEENFMEESVKKRLILAGLKELEAHGPVDFSLRRVALSAEVSCAAPYRHFKSREDLIEAIIAYIKGQWLLMCETIESAVPDLRARVRALCIAYMRFWIGNPNFRAVLFLSDHADALGSIQVKFFFIHSPQVPPQFPLVYPQVSCEATTKFLTRLERQSFSFAAPKSARRFLP